MYKLNNFRKGCPVCNAVTKSLTKKYCDHCKAELVEFKPNYTSTCGGTPRLMTWIWVCKEE